MIPTTELPEFVRGLVNLASPRLGAEAVAATDEFFAAKERMLADAPAVFIPDKYDDHGKWMDGWESRRRRGAGHDWCVVRLGVKGTIRGVDIDTSHFTGNYPPAASIEACLSDRAPDERSRWTTILPTTKLGPDAHHYLPVASDGVFNYLKLHIHPDGGVARLRVYGEPVAAWEGKDRAAIYELSALANGGRIVAYNDAHYGTVWTLLTAGRGLNMGDGWETRRRREPGNDWIIVRLGAAGTIETVEVDTAHYKGNYPDRCSLQAALVTSGTDSAVITQSMFWDDVLAPQKLSMDKVHAFGGDLIRGVGPVNHVKLNIYPDGGISRLRVFGRLA
ncbi:MAG TPA: allantoicase [Dongiaceae bacterium]|nr:allantoicase [Dongiaceae bacterium]